MKLIIDDGAFPQEAVNKKQMDALSSTYSTKRKVRTVSSSGLILADDRMITVTGTAIVTLTLPSGFANGTGICQAVAIKNLKPSGTLTLAGNTGTDVIYPYGGTTGNTTVNIPSGNCTQVISSSATEWVTVI